MYHLIPITAVCCYLLAAIRAVRHLLRGEAERGIPELLSLGLLLHFAYLVVHSTTSVFGADEAHRYPDALSLISFFIIAAFMFRLRDKPVSRLGAFVIPLGALFLLLSGALVHISGATALPSGGGVLLFVHVLLAILANVLLVLAVGISLAIILQEKGLKRRRLTAVMRRLPALTELDKLHGEALSIGFVLMLAGILSGFVYAATTDAGLISLDSRFLWSLATLAVYAVLFSARYFRGWRGSRAAWLALVGFGVLISSFCGLYAAGGTFHAF